MRFVFSWYLPDQPKTMVQMKLEAIGGGTRASVLHSGWNLFDEADVRVAHDALTGGWRGYVLPNLKRMSEVV